MYRSPPAQDAPPAKRNQSPSEEAERSPRGTKGNVSAPVASPVAPNKKSRGPRRDGALPGLRRPDLPDDQDTSQQTWYSHSFYRSVKALPSALRNVGPTTIRRTLSARVLPSRSARTLLKRCAPSAATGKVPGEARRPQSGGNEKGTDQAHFCQQSLSPSCNFEETPVIKSSHRRKGNCG